MISVSYFYYAAAMAMNLLRSDKSNQAGAISIGLKVHWKYANAKNDTGEEAVFSWISV
jgi:hypothetical protein